MRGCAELWGLAEAVEGDIQSDFRMRAPTNNKWFGADPPTLTVYF